MADSGRVWAGEVMNGSQGRRGEAGSVGRKVVAVVVRRRCLRAGQHSVPRPLCRPMLQSRPPCAVPACRAPVANSERRRSPVAPSRALAVVRVGWRACWLVCGRTGAREGDFGVGENSGVRSKTVERRAGELDRARARLTWLVLTIPRPVLLVEGWTDCLHSYRDPHHPPVQVSPLQRLPLRTLASSPPAHSHRSCLLATHGGGYAGAARHSRTSLPSHETTPKPSLPSLRPQLASPVAFRGRVGRHLAPLPLICG